VTVSNHAEVVTLHKVGVVSQVYPFVKTGSFECSDPLMNAIWELGWRTLRVCAEDSYTDTPFRERGHYAGDLFPEYAITCATSGDYRLMKHTFRMLTNAYNGSYTHRNGRGNGLGDFAVINMMIATWYIRQYHDMDFAREIYPKYSYFLDHAWDNLRNEDGLFRPGYAFIEWVPLDNAASLTAFQALMAGGYNDLAFLSGMLNKPDDKARYEEYARTVSAAMDKKLWNEANGKYYDGYNDNGFLTTTYPNSSAFPMVWGINNADKAQTALSYLSAALPDIGPPVNRQQVSTPYGGFYTLAALYKYHAAALAEEFIRKYWGKMIYEGDDTAWEDFNRDDHSTMSHAWSGSPTYYLSTQVLGVDLGFPSYASSDTVFIAPQAETITWAKGCVPHPKGLVTVDWKSEAGTLYLHYTAPEGVPVVVAPKGKLAQLKLKINEPKNIK
jgi:alpha-L-rhamnosidase